MSSNPDSRPIRPVVRLLAELGVIILGVLIALAADSWWQSRNDRERELSYLRDIRTDMTVAIGNLDAAIAEDSATTARAQANLDILYGRVTPTDASAERFLRFEVAQPTVPDGSLTALLGTGDVGLVQNVGLRSTLIRESAALSSRLSIHLEVVSQAGANFRDFLLAWEAIRIRAAAGGREPSLSDLRSDPTIVGGTLIYFIHMENILNAERAAREAAASILSAVEDELARRD